MPLNLPEPDTTRLTKSPLELVVCQLRFESHPEVSEADLAATIHAALGGAEGPYPKIDELNQKAFDLTMGPGAPPSVKTQTSRGWQMSSADGKWIVTLRPDQVALETSAYTTWAGDFEDRLAKLVDTVAETVRPAFAQRLGLRYVDRIKELGLGSIQGWKEYIRPEFLGPILHSEVGEAVIGAQQLVVLDLGDEVQCNIKHGPLPPDDGRVDYVLDYDIFRQSGQPFDADRIKREADAFNTSALQLFHASIEDKLREELR